MTISGDTAVVGAPGEGSAATGVNGDQGNGMSSSGAAYVFVRGGTTWTQQAYVKASNTGAGDSCGCSVSISGDTLAVGAYCEDSAATNVNGDQADNSARDAGAAYVFVRGGTTWSQQAYLKASNGEGQNLITNDGDSFGWSVAVSGDTAVVGAYAEDSAATGINGNQSDNSVSGAGAAYVFVRSGTIWSQQTYLKASNAEAFDNFGYAVAISGDTAMAGAPGEDSAATGMDGDRWDNSASGSGAAYVFVANSATRNLTTIANHGSVTGAGSYPLNATAQLVPTADPGYVFYRWTGDAEGQANPLSVPMDANKTIIANFVESAADPDGDSLTNYQEIVVYHTNPNIADTDGDGFTDGYEIQTGKLPLDPLDKPALVAEARTAIEFTFPAALGKTYRIEGSTDLANWATMESSIAGNGAVIQRFYSTRNMPKRYFRVEEVAAP